MHGQDVQKSLSTRHLRCSSSPGVSRGHDPNGLAYRYHRWDGEADDRNYSILYKTKLPFILVFNKTDVQPHEFALEWMQDFEAFQEALATHRGTTDDEGEPTYMNSLMNSMSLVLDEFYKHLTVRLQIVSWYLWALTWRQFLR